MLLDINLLGFEGYKPVFAESLEGFDIKAENTFDSEKVDMKQKELPAEEGKGFVAELSPLSFNVIRFKK